MGKIANLFYNLKRRILMIFVQVFLSLMVGLIVGGLVYFLKGNILLSAVVTFGIGFLTYILYESFGLIQEEGLM